MKRRKAISLALGIALVLSLFLTRPASAAYSDTAGHWAESAIERWSGFGVVRGSNGSSLTIRDATVGEVNVAEGAKNVTVRAERTANIGTVNTRSAGTTVSGTGKIETIVGAYTDRRTAPTSGGGSSGSGGGSDMPAYVYALMNIPYGEFYAAEGAADAVSSATKNGKARNVNVNGASYHESADAVTTEGIAGVMYPVRATAAQLAALKNLGAVAVTDSTKPVSYEMSARGKTTTVTLEGKDILQESPRYSYYVLSGTPVSYKTLNVSDGTVSFGKAAGTPTTGEAGGTVTVGGRHADIEISLSGIEIEPKEVSAVTVTTADGAVYAQHHVVNIWRGTEIGWNLSGLDLGGKTITNVRYYLKDGTVTDYAVSLEVAKAGYVLMNIPYGEFYAAEGVESVDAVTSATKMKPRTGTLAGGSYHVNADSVAEETITNVTFITRSGKYSCDVSIPVKKDYSGAITAAFTAADSVTISGLPEDVENPVATVKTQVGRGETPVVIAENVPVTNGVVTTADAAASGTTYTITVTSDNYADLSATAIYEEA